MDKNCQIIPFRNLRNRMVQTDEAKAFKDSFFKEVYDQAAALTNIIAGANEQKRNFDENVIPRQQTRTLQNVIAFTGRRGTGKTSAMLSFAEALSDGRYMNKTLDGNENPYTALQGKQFYAVQYVDSSIVSKDEDFFEILLYRMLQYLNCYVEAYNQKSYFKYDAYLSEIKEKIFKLYNHYTSIRRKELSEVVSSYTLMEKNIEKHNVRNEIIKLVEDYIKFVNLLKTDGSCDGEGKGFLVICIDDIDMANNSSHLDILQCIYQYFMIPNVVVMITLNIPVINATMNKSFYTSMEVQIGSEKEHLLRLSRYQTIDFLRKIIPSDMRITMPSWKKYDYRTLKPTLISFENLEKENGKEGIFPNLKGCNWYKEGHETMSPKELIMLLLADRTGIFLDMKGLKIHFMEPDSLRNLYDLFYLLYQMKNIKEEDKNNSEKKEKYYKDREYNRNILLNYLYFKMILEFNLNHALEFEFKGIQAEPMHRRGRRIWDYYYKLFLKPENKERIKMLYSKDFFTNEKEKYKISNYCFGELFRCLYFASRLDIVDKEFIKAILASFAFTLPQYIEMEKKSYNEKLKALENDKKEIAKLNLRRFENLRNLFGYSFLGTWRRELYSGHKSDKENHVSIHIDINTFKNNFNEGFEYLIYLFLLSTRSMKSNMTATLKKNEKNKEMLVIDADLDPTAFMMGTVRAYRLCALRFNFTNQVYKFNDAEGITLSELFNKVGIADDITEEIDEQIDDIAKNVNNNNELIWFLLKHTDITYNVIKRTVFYFLYYSDANLQVRDVEYTKPYEIFSKFYEKFKEKLEEELDKYQESQALYNKYTGGKVEYENISPVIEYIISKNYGNCGCTIEWTDENDSKSTE